MAYTPINWQTGDTITAEKLNKCDNGWSVETTSTTYFSGSVTTADDGNGSISGTLVGSPQITVESIIVTCNGTEYNCTGRYNGDGEFWEYGAPWSDDLGNFDFSTYPFNIYSDAYNTLLYTETAGAYTLKIETSSTTIETSDNFAKVRGYWTTTASTTLTDENITTSGNNPSPVANLVYDTEIAADTLIVTFDGTDYTVSKTVNPMGNMYGEAGSSGPSFTNYPFCILSSGGANVVYTETAGTYTIKIAEASEIVETSTNFKKALSFNITDTSGTLDKTFAEIRDAFLAGKNCFILRNNKYYLVYAVDVATLQINISASYYEASSADAYPVYH